ncbi:hypothetical protein Tco_0559969 [Tanacetum coccineum]
MVAEVSTKDQIISFYKSHSFIKVHSGMTIELIQRLNNLSIDVLGTITLEFLSTKSSVFQKHLQVQYILCALLDTSSTNVPEKEVLAGFADEVIYFLFAKQSED